MVAYTLREWVDDEITTDETITNERRDKVIDIPPTNYIMVYFMSIVDMLVD